MRRIGWLVEAAARERERKLRFDKLILVWLVVWPWLAGWLDGWLVAVWSTSDATRQVGWDEVKAV